MKNNLVLLFLLLSFIFCKENNLRQDTQSNNLDEEVTLKTDEGIIAACRIACGWKLNEECFIRCLQAMKGTGSGGDKAEKKEEVEVQTVE